MLSESQRARIFELLALLSLYTNRYFDLIDEDELSAALESDDPARLELLRNVAQTLWENVDIIDRFASENPFDLPASELAVAKSWKDALHASAFFVGTERGRELYLTDDRIIAVEQSEERGSEPCLVDMVFLPFEGTIVEDFNGIAMDIDFEVSPEFDIRAEAAQARKRGVIDTADKLIAYSRLVNQTRHDAEMEQLLADAARESRLRAGEDISPEGFHRGLLAGLPREERERLATERAEAEALPVPLDHLRKSASKAAPGTTLAACLLSLNKSYIQDIARECSVSNYSTLRKNDLACKVARDLLAGEGEEGSLLATLCGALPSAFIKQTEQLIEAGGRLDLTEQEFAAMRPYPHPHPPLTFLFRNGEGFTLAMPDDVRKRLASFDFEAAYDRARARERAVNLAGEATEAYGVISLEDAYAELELLDEAPIPFEEFSLLIDMEAADSYGAVDTWCHNGTVYLVHWVLSDAEIGCDELLDDDLRDAINAVFEQFDPTDASNEEAIRQALENNLHAAFAERASQQESALEEAQSERIYLVESQQELPRKHLYEFRKDGNVFEALMASPAVSRLEEYLNERIPDGQSDYFFAEKVAEEMVMAVVQRNADAGVLLSLAIDLGLDGCDDDPRRLVGLLGNLRNSMPLWELNGWSAIEQFEMSTGRKLFLDDFGMPKKIGRNDPCPCGSGKKYKRCCGR